MTTADDDFQVATLRRQFRSGRAALRYHTHVAVKLAHSRALLLSTLVMIGGVLSAHHSTSAEFDVTHRMTLSGTLTKVDWVNPHIIIFVTAKSGPGDAKDEAWKFQSNPPAWFRRVGVSRADFAKALGQTVTVEGNRAKDGSLFGYLLKVTFADGNSLELVAAQAAGNP